MGVCWSLGPSCALDEREVQLLLPNLGLGGALGDAGGVTGAAGGAETGEGELQPSAARLDVSATEIDLGRVAMAVAK